MEYIFNITETQTLPVYYRIRKMTTNQTKFTQDFINEIEHSNNLLIQNKKSLYSFSPSLDKNYLYHSAAYSLSKYQNRNFLILLNSEEEVIHSLSLFKDIHNNSSKGKSHPHIIPLLSKKSLCVNDDLFSKSNSADFDYFCNALKTKSEGCSYYKNSKRLSIELENYYFEESLTNIEFQKQSLCPFYYNLNYIDSLLNSDNKENYIILCPIQNIWNIQNFSFNYLSILNNHLHKMHIIIDNFETVNSLIVEKFSINIDEETLNSSIKQIELLLKVFDNLEEKVEKVSLKSKDGISDTNSLFTHNILVQMLINKVNVIKDSKNDKDEILYPGNIQNPIYFLNLLLRIINFFKIKLFSYLSKATTNNTIITQYYLYEFMMREYIDVSSFKFLLSRLYELLLNNKITSIEGNSFSNYYHLISFVTLLSILELSTDKTIFNCYTVNYIHEIVNNEEKNILEIVIINPGKLFDRLTSSKDEFLNNDILFPKDLEKNKIISDLSSISINNNAALLLLSNGLPSDIELFCKVSLNNSTSYKHIVEYELTQLELDIIKNNINYTFVSQENSKNLTFYSDNLIKLTKVCPDGIVCYFSSYKLLEDYIYLWNLNGKDSSVFNSILNNKLIFIETANNSDMSKIIQSYKIAVDSGRGAVLLLSCRNRMVEQTKGKLKGQYSRSIVFFGFNLETRFNTKYFEAKLAIMNLLYQIKQEEFLYYDTFKLASDLITGNISDIYDKKFLMFLDEKLLCSDNAENYYAKWLVKRLEIDENNSYIEERIKNINS